MKTCPICLNVFTSLHAHHTVPKAYGGDPDGYLLHLCAACHNAIHFQAESEYAIQFNNKKTSPDSKNKMPDGDLQRARRYIDVIKIAKFNYENATNLDDIPKKIFLEVPNKTLVQMHKRKASLGFKSLEKYLEYLINNDVSKL